MENSWPSAIQAGLFRLKTVRIDKIRDNRWSAIKIKDMGGKAGMAV